MAVPPLVPHCSWLDDSRNRVTTSYELRRFGYETGTSSEDLYFLWEETSYKGAHLCRLVAEASSENRGNETPHVERGIFAPLESRGKDIKQSGEPHSGSLRCVCGACNNGWMSKLQSDAKPILLPLLNGEPFRLFRRQQTILAAWITMFTIVSEFRDRTGMQIAIPPADGRWLKERLDAPKGWKIWIGLYERKDWKGIWSHAAVPIASREHIPETVGSGRPIPNTQSTAVVIGKLYVHVLSSVLPTFVQRHELDSAILPRIRPFRTSPISWPPKVTLDDEKATRIAFAFINQAKRIPPADLDALRTPK